MDLLDLFTNNENSAPVQKMKTIKKRRSFCDILPELPVFENTQSRLRRATRRRPSALAEILSRKRD